MAKREGGGEKKERGRERVRDASNRQDLGKAEHYSSERLENYGGYCRTPSDKAVAAVSLATRSCQTAQWRSG